MKEGTVTYGRILRLWAPLSVTWVMVSIEGPFLAAVIARLAEPTINLAAYGVAFAFALIFEAPIIMVLSATTALVADRESFRKMRNFTYGLNVLITLAMLAILWRPIFEWLSQDVMMLPSQVAELSYAALITLLPWPAAIGYRRFYQGLLIRQELSRRVAYGTGVRLIAMTGTALLLYYYFDLEGTLVGSISLSSGVVTEAIATRFMARGLSGKLPQVQETSLSYRKIYDFYFPLAMTSLLSLGAHPMITFALGQSRMALESLAVYPVVSSLSFIFRSVALSYQEVAITFLDDSREHFVRIARFALGLGIISALGLVIIAFTPLSVIWFNQVSGLEMQLAELSVYPLRLFCLFPFFSVLLSFQRAILVFGRKTRPITTATSIELAGIVGILYLTIGVLDTVGVVAAVVALFGGRLLANAYSMFPTYHVLREAGIFRSEGSAGSQ